jgi:peptidoglycan/LPS O-acetylase OafA/YrhL
LHCGFQLTQRSWDLISFHTDVRLNSLLIPAVLTVIAHERNLFERYKQWFRFWPVLLVATIVMISFVKSNIWTVQCLAILLPCMIYGSVLNPHSLPARFLEWAPLRFVGRISYSLYLWQQLFDIDHSSHGFHQLGSLQGFPFFYIATFSAALLSYFLIEKPLIRLGHRWSALNVSVDARTSARGVENDVRTPHTEPETVTAEG